MTIQRPQFSALDPGRREAFQRAINIAGAGTILMQSRINTAIQQIVLRELGASSTLIRRPGSGNAEYIDRRAPGAAAGWVADTDPVAEATGTYTQHSFLYRTLATRGRVTRKMQAVGKSYTDILAGELVGRAGDTNETLEEALIIGDTALNANQFNGLITLTQLTASQIVIQTNVAVGDVLTLEKLDEAIDACKGTDADKVIYASMSGRRKINAAAVVQQVPNNPGIVGAAGFRVSTYNNIPVVPTTKMPDVLTFNGTKVTAYGGGVTTAILVVNRQLIQIAELTAMTAMPLGKVDSQYDEFDLFWDGVLSHDNTLGSSILCGIA